MNKSIYIFFIFLTFFHTTTPSPGKLYKKKSSLQKNDKNDKNDKNNKNLPEIHLFKMLKKDSLIRILCDPNHHKYFQNKSYCFQLSEYFDKVFPRTVYDKHLTYRKLIDLLHIFESVNNWDPMMFINETAYCLQHMQKLEGIDDYKKNTENLINEINNILEKTNQ